MTEELDPTKVNWAYDLLHGGLLFESIRTDRGLTQDRVAELASIGKPSISRFEKGSQPSVLDYYLKALQSPEVDAPLTQDEVDVLRDIYLSSRPEERQRRQEALSWISFSDLTSGRFPELSALAKKLAETDKPAFIMDPTLSVHAMNGAVLRLFNVDEKSGQMNRWEFWNNFTCKFYIGSPFYAAHANKDLYFPQTIVSFFQSPLVRPYWFTWQMRVLIWRVHNLARQVDFPFARAWHQATTFSHPFKLNSVNRSLNYSFSAGNNQTIYAEANFTHTCPVEIAKGIVIPYLMGEWELEGEEGQRVLKDIQQSPDSHKVYFTADFDTMPESLHVNTWPEVQAELQKSAST